MARGRGSRSLSICVASSGPPGCGDITRVRLHCTVEVTKPFVVQFSLRSRRYSRAQGEKLEIPPAQKLSILSSAHRAHGSAHINVFALENQSERELLIMLLAGLQCSKRCQFNNCFVFFYHGEQNNSHETFVKAYTVNIVLLPTPVGKIAITSVYTKQQMLD